MPVTKSPQAWIRTSPFGSRSNSAGSAWPIDVSPEHARAAERLQAAGEALRRAARQPVDENGDGTVERLDALAGAVDEARNRRELQLRLPRLHHAERLRAPVRKCPASPMIIAASPPGLPRRSITMPSALAKLVDRLSGTGRSTAVIHTLKPMTPAAFPAGVGITDDDTRTYIVGRLPTVTGVAVFRQALESSSSLSPLAPSRNVMSTGESDGPRSRDTLSRHAWS